MVQPIETLSESQKAAMRDGIGVSVVDSVAELLAIGNGDFVRTLGYYTPGDGGGNTYIYRTTGKSFITIDGGFYLSGVSSDDYFEAIDKKIAVAKQFGAVGDGVSDDTEFLRKWINSQASTAVLGCPGDVFIIESDNLTGYVLEITKAGSRTIDGGGATIKIASGSIEFGWIFGSTSVHFDRFTLKNIVIDWNKENQSYTVEGISLTYGNRALRIQRANIVAIENCVFKNVVTRQALFINGYDGSTSNIQIDKVFVTNNKFISVGKNGLGYFDSSLIYAHSNYAEISNNFFEAESIDTDGAVTAIEIHCGRFVVCENYVDGFESVAFLTGVYAGGDTENSIANSNFGRVTRNGIKLLSLAYGPHTSGFGLNGVILNGNLIIVEQEHCLARHTQGIMLGIGIGSGSTLPVNNISIISNVIEFQRETAALDYTAIPVGAVGITEATSSTPESFYSNITIDSNVIINSPGPGIALGTGNGDYKNVNIRNNLIVNPASTKTVVLSDTYTNAIIVNANSIIGAINILQNQIIDDFDETVLRYASVFSIMQDSKSNSDVRFTASIVLNGTDTSAFANFVRMLNENSIVLFDCQLNKDEPLFLGTRAFKAGSRYFIQETSVQHYLRADGTTFVTTGYSSVAPSSGTHERGSVRYNTLPEAGGSVGFICTESGTPGTWKTFGNIES